MTLIRMNSAHTPIETPLGICIISIGNASLKCQTGRIFKCAGVVCSKINIVMHSL